MPTHCTQDLFDFGRVEGRSVVADFSGGTITSNAGALLLGKANQAMGIIDSFAACFGDGRNQGLIEHSVRTMVGQRVIGIALGHEDLIDHDDLRHDPVMAAMMGKLTPRRKECAPLAGKSTLSRLEHSPQEGLVHAPPRYHKISHDGEAIERAFADIALRSTRHAPATMVIDLDATDSALHGHQEGRFFHGYYDCYCYLPLFVFWGRHLLSAKLRRPTLTPRQAALRRWRASWRRCVRAGQDDDHRPRRQRLLPRRLDELVRGQRGALRAWSCPQPQAGGRDRGRAGRGSRRCRSHWPAGPRLKDFAWSTLDSWSRSRRVIAKAEWTHGEANPRFIVTSLPADVIEAGKLYEKVYCQRGEMENRIEECQLDLLAWPHAHRDDARQPASPVVREHGLRADVCAGPHCARRHGAGARHLRHDPAEASQDRRPGDRVRPAHPHRHDGGLPGASDLRARACTIVTPPRA